MPSLIAFWRLYSEKISKRRTAAFGLTVDSTIMVLTSFYCAKTSQFTLPSLTAKHHRSAADVGVGRRLTTSRHASDERADVILARRGPQSTAIELKGRVAIVTGG